MTIFSSKALLLSTTALIVALLFNLSVPLLRDLFDSVVPQIWSSLASWLEPPYLYLVINGIIISIAASFKFQQKEDDEEADPSKNPAEFGLDFQVSEEVELAGEEESKEEEFVASRSEWDRRRDPMEDSFAKDKPPVSARFGHRKSAKASPEGSRALRVAKPKRHETLESTWKAITEGRSMPLARHLKKSDTWDTNVRSEGQDPIEIVKKSETMNDQVTSASPISSRSSGKLLRKESSLSQDELNRRVEAFIKKFNEDMRLQRQESLQNYMEMVSLQNI